MKLLFLCNNDITTQTGGGIVSKRNFSLCSMIAETDYYQIQRRVYFNKLSNPFLIKIINKFITFFLNLLNRPGGLSWELEKNILDKVINNAYDLVFIDSSLYGRLIKPIKRKKNVKIIVFFHNCEYKFFCDQTNLLKYFLASAAHYNENKSINGADFVYFISEKDRIETEIIYHKKIINYKILPVTLTSTGFIGNNNRDSETLLFVGSAFYANIHAVLWFVKNVLPFIKKKFLIIGRGMKSAIKLDLIDSSLRNRIQIIDHVSDLTDFYRQVKYVIAPVFIGSGMKVKIAEAFMYGNFVIGTDFAFEGYKKDELILRVCNSSADFIKVLKTEISYDERYIYNYFLSHYETNCVVEDFTKQIKNIIEI
jgi:hypothetical protein